MKFARLLLQPWDAFAWCSLQASFKYTYESQKNFVTDAVLIIDHGWFPCRRSNSAHIWSCDRHMIRIAISSHETSVSLRRFGIDFIPPFLLRGKQNTRPDGSIIIGDHHRPRLGSVLPRPMQICCIFQRIHHARCKLFSHFWLNFNEVFFLVCIPEKMN